MFKWLEKHITTCATIGGTAIGMYGYFQDSIPLTYAILGGAFGFYLIQAVWLNFIAVKKINKLMANLHFTRHMWALEIIKYMNLTKKEREKQKDELTNKILKDFKEESLSLEDID